MTDYSHLGDVELDREIATRLGWEFFPDSRAVKSPLSIILDISELPHWSMSLDKAITLLRPDTVYFDLDWDQERDTWTADIESDPFPTGGTGEDSFAARAVCLAWLEWQDAKRE